MIEGSSAWSTTVGSVVTMRPRGLADHAVEPRDQRDDATRLAKNAASTYSVERTPKRLGASMISAVSD